MRVLSSDGLRLLYQVRCELPSAAADDAPAVLCEPAAAQANSAQIALFVPLSVPLPTSISSARQGGAVVELCWSPDSLRLAARRSGARNAFIVDARMRALSSVLVTLTPITALAWSSGAPPSQSEPSMHSHYAPLLAIAQRESSGVVLLSPGHAACRLPTPL